MMVSVRWKVVIKFILHCGIVLATDFEDLSLHSGQSVTSTSNVFSDAIQVKAEPSNNDCNPFEFQEEQYMG